MHAGTTFIGELFAHSSAPIYFCSLPNIKGDDREIGEQFIRTRTIESVERHIEQWDRDGRAYYFCVSTIANGQRRAKATCIETPALHTDLDFKTIADDQPTATDKLKGLRYPPSYIVYSGHGLHAWWQFKEPLRTAEYQERIEATLKQLADVVGGDYEPTHVAALMRLPGTRNSKIGGAAQICEVVWSSGHRYELSDIEDWLSEQSPVIKRRVLPEREAEDPYTRIGRIYGFKGSTDVEARLTAMTYQGVGDAAIHATQLAVTSSLISRGDDVERVIEVVLEATRAAAGAYGARWNWKREETNIRRMCESWVKKIAASASPPPRSPSPRSASSGGSGASATVHNLAAAREAKQEQRREEAASKHGRLALAVLQAIRGRGDDIMFCDGPTFYVYHDHSWALMPKADYTVWIHREIETACNALNIKATVKFCSEVRESLMRNVSLYHHDVAWDQHGKVPTRSGLINPLTLELSDASPAHFSTWRIPFNYVPGADCPLFDELLATTFAGQPVVIEAFWQWLGSGLLDSRPRGMRKVLVLVGGTDSGKSVLLDIVAELFGGRVISVSFDELDKAHGTWPFRERLPWVLPEAFASEKWHTSAILKAIVTGDVFSINPKGGTPLTHRFNAPIIWASNVPPQFKDPTEATVNRLIVVGCRQRFDEASPIGVARIARDRGFAGPAELIAASELPGILNSALAGLQRALKANAIIVPEEARATAREIMSDANAMREFVNDYCAFDPAMMVSCPDFRVAFNAHRDDLGLQPMTATSITRSLAALNDGRVGNDKHDIRLGPVRYYIGLAFNSDGELLRKRAVESARYQQRPQSHVSPVESAASRPIPAAWDDKPAVCTMRGAYAAP